MKGKGVSRDYSPPRTRSRNNSVNSCKIPGNLDNIVVIDVDSEGVDDVIIIDVPDSLRQKFRGSGTVRREGKRFPRVIIVDEDDDDDDEEDEGDYVDHFEDNLGSDGSSSNGSDASGYRQKSVDRDADHLIRKKRPAFKLSKCNRTYAEKAPSRNRYGLNSESDNESSDQSTSDCEVMEGSVEELREQWEKASLNRKSKVGKGPSGLPNQASQCSSHGNVHPNVEVESSTKQNPEPSAFPSSRNVNSNKMNSFVSTANGDKFAGVSFNSRMDNPFAKLYQEDGWEGFSVWWERRTHKNTHFQSKADNFFGGETFMEESNASHDKFRNVNGCDASFPSGHSSWSNQEKDDNKHHPLSNTQTRPNFNDDGSLHGNGCFTETHNFSFTQVDLKEKDEEFTQAPPRSSCNNCSNEAQYGKTFVSNARSSDEKGDENVVASSLVTPEVRNERSVYKNMDETDYRGKSLQCHGALNNPGTSSLAEGVEPSTNFLSSSQPHSESDIINVREKLKETDEYKQAIEEEWAARQRQLQIQAEEAQRLRKRRKAESLRILDMERRQKQRVQEVRETQKKDEENLNMKERFRVEIRKQLQRLEFTCINMASLLRGLGIDVEGGFQPLSHQVSKAYKRALLKFHPDRVSKADIRQQVEAEEKFKLISRMKEKFLPTA